MSYKDEESQRRKGFASVDSWMVIGSVAVVLTLAGIGVLFTFVINHQQFINYRLDRLERKAATGLSAMETAAKVAECQPCPNKAESLTTTQQSSAASPSTFFYFDPPQTRNELGQILEARGYKVGAELGVQRGHFSATTLRNWRSCKTYYLVDIWRTQENYEDLANVPQAEQDKLYVETQNNLAEWKAVTRFYRNFTSEAAKLITEPLDYVYVDARHDYCGATEDISLYWPKIRSGGIMAGHDYLTAGEAEAASGQHWEKCMNGSIHPGAVRGAVNEFFKKLNTPVYVTYKDSPWASWLVIKP